jgi:hypothetical protein
MSNDIDDRTASYLNELAQCDRDDRAAEKAEMCAPALIFILWALPWQASLLTKQSEVHWASSGS